MIPKLLLLIFAVTLLSVCADKRAGTGGLTAAQALSTFQLPDGFKIELVASEPLISDPVAMEVDEHGNIYVVEMHGYPLDTTGSGAVKLLTDTDGDGAPDKSVTFADHLRLPTGVMKWKKGVLVVDVPDIIYLEDTDNDGIADRREVIITGLALTNPQHIANTPVFGPDNWIYVAHMGVVTPKVSMEFNDTGRSVRFAASGSQQLPRDAGGRNIRFNPDTRQLEMMSGESQYGHTFDPWGHHFGTSNADHLFHEVIATRYLQSNPALLVSDASDHIPDHGLAAEVYPITKNPEHQLLTDVGVITSSCGVTWYQGGLFPETFNNVTFIAEPVHNLVHADKVTAKGATFTAARLYEKKEFLASTDPWFRPVQFYIGPDGALYVIDYYRQIIEHPEWMSDEVNKSGALYNGADKGRIYRVTPSETAALNWNNKLSLASASVSELANLLASNNIWWRRNAQRLLLDKKDPNTASLVTRILDTTTAATAFVHGLWTLHGLHALDASIIRKALMNAAPGVRENAIQIAELHLDQFLDLGNDLIALQNDTSASVRFQLLCTLGKLNSRASEEARGKILIKDIEDKWCQLAALTSSAGKELTLIEQVLPILSDKPSEGRKLFFQNCASVIGLSGRKDDIGNLVNLATQKGSPAADWWQASCLTGLAKAMRTKGYGQGGWIDHRNTLIGQFNTATPAVRAAAIDMLALLPVDRHITWSQAIEKAKAFAFDKTADATYRRDAVRLIAIDKTSINPELLGQLIEPAEPENVQRAALFAYNRMSAQDACAVIISRWKSFTPDLRDVAMEIFFSSVDNMNLLLSALEKHQIAASAISWPRMVELMNNDDDGIRNRSRSILAINLDDREAVYKKYEAALTAKGDAAKGLQIFKTVCSGCHQLGGQYGNAFGPDLASIRNRDAKFIMADILNPNRSIADKYETWNIVKKDGEKFSGIIASETPNAITMRDLGRRETLISRSEIKTMEASSSSAMPVGLESSISVKDMADILAFLKDIH